MRSFVVIVALAFASCAMAQFLSIDVSPPSLASFSPWGVNSYTSTGQIATGAPLTNTSSGSVPAAGYVTIAVDVVNKVWFFGQYDGSGTLVQAQWALANSSYILQGGACYPRANWNYDHQRVGFSYLTVFDQLVGPTPISPAYLYIAGPAYDIASCGCEEVAAMKMRKGLLGYSLANWFFAQSFPFIRSAYGDLFFDDFVFGTPDPSIYALPASCTAGTTPDYCAIFGENPCPTVIPNPTNF